MVCAGHSSFLLACMLAFLRPGEREIQRKREPTPRFSFSSPNHSFLVSSFAPVQFLTCSSAGRTFCSSLTRTARLIKRGLGEVSTWGARRRRKPLLFYLLLITTPLPYQPPLSLHSSSNVLPSSPLLPSHKLSFRCFFFPLRHIIFSSRLSRSSISAGALIFVSSFHASYKPHPHTGRQTTSLLLLASPVSRLSSVQSPSRPAACSHFHRPTSSLSLFFVCPFRQHIPSIRHPPLTHPPTHPHIH